MDQIKPKNDSPRVKAYDDFKRRLAEMRSSSDPHAIAARKELQDAAEHVRATKSNRALESLIADPAFNKAITPGSTNISTLMGNMSVMYANEDYIGDSLLPVIPCDNLAGEYPVFAKRDRLAYPDDLIKNRSEAPEIDESVSYASYSCEPRGLQRALEQKAIANSASVFDWMTNLVEQVAEARAFLREKRQMTVLTTSANYGSNTAAIAAGDRWDTATGGNPVKDVTTAKDAVWRGRGASRLVGFCSLAVYRALVTNQSILDTLKYTKGGVATKDQLKMLFELDDLFVSQAWEDTANEGQTASYARMMTAKSFGVVRVAASPARENVSFGYTMLFQNKVNTFTWFEEHEGTQGTWKHKQATDEIVKVVASDAGYLLTTVIS